MVTLLLDIVAIGAMAVGVIATTIALYGVLRMPDAYSQLHAAGMASTVGVVAILVASVATGDAATITSALLVVAFLVLTAPVSSHAIAWAAYRRHTDGPPRSAESGRPTESSQ
jgi:multicomponent Na+:H+ antiporter subunit G